jgi:hypothetical protein
MFNVPYVSEKMRMSRLFNQSILDDVLSARQKINFSNLLFSEIERSKMRRETNNLLLYLQLCEDLTKQATLLVDVALCKSGNTVHSFRLPVQILSIYYKRGNKTNLGHSKFGGDLANIFRG